MNKLDRLETFAQRVIEGSFNRLFNLTPVKEQKTAKTETAEIPVTAVSNRATRWHLQVESRQIKLGEPVIRIGRALDNDIIVSNPTVSRYHAQLRWRRDSYFLCPPDPHSNGEIGGQTIPTQSLEQKKLRTTVNHQPVSEQPLASGDVIRLGNAVLTVFVEPENTNGQG